MTSNPAQGFMASDKKYQSCAEDLPEKIFWMTEEEKKLDTPTNIVGYYIRMVEKFFTDSDDFSKISVKPGLNNSFFESFGDPFITIRRGDLVPMNLGITGNRTALPDAIPAAGIATIEERFPDASINDSAQYKDFVNMKVSSTVYASTLAECEKIGAALHALLMALSYDILKMSFPFIQYATPPMMTQVDTVEKHDDVYMLNIIWEVEYWDEVVVLIKKNLIKYAKIIVRDEPEERLLHRF